MLDHGLRKRYQRHQRHQNQMAILKTRLRAAYSCFPDLSRSLAHPGCYSRWQSCPKLLRVAAFHRQIVEHLLRDYDSEHTKMWLPIH